MVRAFGSAPCFDGGQESGHARLPIIVGGAAPGRIDFQYERVHQLGSPTRRGNRREGQVYADRVDTAECCGVNGCLLGRRTQVRIEGGPIEDRDDVVVIRSDMAAISTGGHGATTQDHHPPLLVDVINMPADLNPCIIGSLGQVLAQLRQSPACGTECRYPAAGNLGPGSVPQACGRVPPLPNLAGAGHHDPAPQQTLAQSAQTVGWRGHQGHGGPPQGFQPGVLRNQQPGVYPKGVIVAQVPRRCQAIMPDQVPGGIRGEGLSHGLGNPPVMRNDIAG